MRFLSFAIIRKRLRSIKAFMIDPEVSKIKKLLIIFGIIYLLSPIDLVPEPVLLVGIADDIVLWAFILFYLKDELDRYWKGDAPVVSADGEPVEDMSGKDIIEGKAEVEDEDE